MKVQGKLERKPLTFSKYSSRDIRVQRSVKLHQKWFTKIWPIVETLAKTAKFVTKFVFQVFPREIQNDDRRHDHEL